jgi:hypothetical protein
MREHPAIEHSKVISGLSRARSRLVGSPPVSRLRNWNERASENLQTAAYHSIQGRLLRYGRRLVRESWCYRWLTKEPDPQFIVIDLRETWTMGPIVTVLDRVGRRLSPRTSALRAVERRVDSAVRARPVQLLSLVVTLVTSLLLVALARMGTTVFFLAPVLGVALLAVLAVRVRLTWSELATPRSITLVSEFFRPPELEEDRE